MKAGVAAAAACLVALGACSPAEQRREPDSEATLPPGGAFRDGLLYAAIKARLAGADIDSATRISVSVHDGAVILTGNVKDAATRAADAKVVRSMRGVKSLDDRLGVGHTGPSAAQAVGDAALVAAVTGSITAQTGVNVSGVRVHAAAGIVTLGGHAGSTALRSTMVDAARRTPGVRNVIDRIAVK